VSIVLRDGGGGRVPIPTEDDINQAVAKDREFSAYSASTRGALTFLNIAFRTGDIATVYMDEARAVQLLAILKALVPNAEGIPACPARLAADGMNREVQWGHMPG
jgi:hypothetical protein